MRTTVRLLLRCAVAAGFIGHSPTNAQTPRASEWSVLANDSVRLISNVTYSTATNFESKLDIYLPLHVSGPLPVVVYFHPGGWVGGGRELGLLYALPFLEMRVAFVNVAYRLAPVALAPAGIEDARCAVRWVLRNARQYNFDSTRVVVVGHSAGGHLALMTAMAPNAAGFDSYCPGAQEIQVRAVVNFCGVADVADILEGSNRRAFAVTWIGSRPDRREIARAVSPLTYVRAGLPPVISVHGDQDPTTPYAHSSRLHDALSSVGVPNQLVTIRGGKHCDFDRAEAVRAQRAVEDFLGRIGMWTHAGGRSQERDSGGSARQVHNMRIGHVVYVP